MSGLPLLPLWEKVDRRVAPRRMRGAGRNATREKSNDFGFLSLERSDPSSTPPSERATLGHLLPQGKPVLSAGGFHLQTEAQCGQPCPHHCDANEDRRTRGADRINEPDEGRPRCHPSRGQSASASNKGRDDRHAKADADGVAHRHEHENYAQMFLHVPRAGVWIARPEQHADAVDQGTGRWRQRRRQQAFMSSS